MAVDFTRSGEAVVSGVSAKVRRGLAVPHQMTITIIIIY